MAIFDISVSDTNPFSLFGKWLEAAKSSEPSDADAACLATVDENGRPSARMVLVRRFDDRGFVFFTNENSRKGQHLLKTKVAALCYHWKSLERQVRVEGHVETVSEDESDSYFALRPRGSRIAANVSQQSQKLESRDALVAEVQALEKQFEGSDDIPRPSHWHGFRIVPDRIEFWQQGQYRLHDRIIFTRTQNGPWTAERQYP